MKSKRRPSIAAVAAAALLCLVLVSMSMTSSVFARYTVGADWTKLGDYLYYNDILTEKDGSSDTTSAAIAIDKGDAQVILLAEAIQAAADASKEGWDATYNNGSWS